MFVDIDVDYYLMVDGDDIYLVEYCYEILEVFCNKEVNMVIGDCLSNGIYIEENKRNFYDFGNLLVCNIINCIFKSNLRDIMIGYCGFDCYFVKIMLVLSFGFEIEIEMSIYVLENCFLVKEIEIDYCDCLEGSELKLNIFFDGFKVIMMIVRLFKNSCLFLFFNLLVFLFVFVGVLVGLLVII